VSGRSPGILFIVNSLGTGGAERQVVTLLNHLDAQRFRLHLAYLKRETDLLDRLRVSRLDALECADVLRRIDPRAIGRLRRLVERHEIDLIVSTNTFSTLYGALVRAVCARPPKLVAVFHTTALHTMKQRLAMRFFRPVFARCDRLVYVCENQRAFWRARGLVARSDAVVYNGIDVDAFADRSSAIEKRALRERLALAEDDYLIGLCGVLRPEKAHGDLLHAVAALRARGVPASAMLIGDGPQRPAIEQTAANLGVAPYVRITGFQADVRPFVSACDVMTLVSHAIETFSLAALESMACGKPLVMSDIGGAREQVAHGVHGLLFAPGDIETLTAHLQRLTDASARAAMGAAASERVRASFTLERMVAGFERQIQEVLGPGTRARPARSHPELSQPPL
jgi:glycosyltransferase involved in cell wall biosynthesis